MIKKIGIIIVSYNSQGELAACIKGAKTSSKKALLDNLVVVVDNNSHDKSVSVARKAGAVVVVNSKNLGFAAGVNQGIRKAFQEGAELILILNPDVKLFPESLKSMVEALGSQPSIGAVGPCLVDSMGNEASEGYYLKTPSWISVVLFSTFLRKYSLYRKWLVSSVYQETGLAQDREVEQIPGACLLTSKAVLEKVGLLDEDFAIWFEDVDWCYRARKKDYKMWFCAGAKVEHEGGTSFEQWQSLEKATTFYISMKTFFNKHKPISGLLVRLAITANSLIMFVKNRDKHDLMFLKRFWTRNKGKLPE